MPFGLYTGNSVYQEINQALRKDDGEGLKTYGSLINLTMQPFSSYAMQQPHSLLKPFVGTVWRGCSLSKNDALKYHVGNVVHWEGFSSTSKKKLSAFGGNFIFEIHCNKCFTAVQTFHWKREGVFRSSLRQTSFTLSKRRWSALSSLHQIPCCG